MSNKRQRMTVEVFDNKTGEIESLSTFVKEIGVHKYISFKNQSKFTKLFSYNKPPFKNELFQFYFYSLLHTAQQFTNIIISKKNGHLIHANKDEIQKILTKSKRTVERFLNEANILGAIIKVDGGSFNGYVINPAYAYNGFGIDPFIFLIFEKNKAFINSLSKKNIQEYYSYTKTDFSKSIKKNFPEIYEKKFSERRGLVLC